MATEEDMENVLGLGELAGLTVANEADSMVYDVSGMGQNYVTYLCWKCQIQRVFYIYIFFLSEIDSCRTQTSLFPKLTVQLQIYFNHHENQLFNSAGNILSDIYLYDCPYAFIIFCCFSSDWQQ